jgi:hypothetical protein
MIVKAIGLYAQRCQNAEAVPSLDCSHFFQKGKKAKTDVSLRPFGSKLANHISNSQH